MLNKDKLYNALTNDFKVVSRISANLGVDTNSARRLLKKMHQDDLIEKTLLPVSYICGLNRKKVMSAAYRLKQL